MAERAEDLLTAAEVRRFVEQGYLWLRGAISPEVALCTVEGIFGSGGSLRAASCRHASRSEAFQYTGQSLEDARAWRTDRVDVDTGFSARIAELSPRLDHAIAQLTGDLGTRRERIGEKWILNVDYVPDAPAPSEMIRARRSAFWHMDSPGAATSLVGRFDALTLLILWSDTLPQGGGTLFCPSSLDVMVRELAGRPEGLDTRGEGWATPFVAECSDLLEMAGRPGDVLLTHPLLLHARPRNYRRAVRILENPTIMVERELDYRRSNPNPSPVEACVIARLSKLTEVRGPLLDRERERDLELSVRRRMLEAHPAHFVPGLQDRGNDRDEAVEQRLSGVDRWLFETWIRREARALGYHHPDPYSAARVAVRTVRQLVASDRDVRGLRLADCLERPGSSGSRLFATLLAGFNDSEGMNYIVGRLMGAIGYQVSPFETASDGSLGSRRLLWVRNEDRGAFVDAWSDVPVVWVEGFDDRARRGPRATKMLQPVSKPFKGVPPYREMAPPGGDIEHRGLYPRDAFLKGSVLDASGLERPDIQALRAEAEAFVADAAEGAQTGRRSVWERFLWLRAEQLDGRLSDPERRYDELLEEDALGGATRRLIVALRAKAFPRAHGRETTDDGPDPLTELIEAVDIPKRGLELVKGVWVGHRSGSSLEFHVGAPTATPIRISVQPPTAEGKAYFRSARFALSYSKPRGRALTSNERRFLSWLGARISVRARGEDVRESRRET